MLLEQALGYARQNRERFLGELQEFVSIPSISTLSEHKGDVRRAAEWCAAQLRALGLSNVAVLATGGHPIAYGEWLGAPGKPTILIYGHYDVQPVDPLDEWTTPPFQPTLRGDNLYARGASDMKGNAHEVLKALEAWSHVLGGRFPVNVKIFFEGEEEIGSPHLGAFIDTHREQLQCDLVLNADSSILRPDLPSLVYALRGLTYFDLKVYGPAQDLHSGLFGGAVHNPAQVLCELIAGMHDARGRVTLPGFYNKVRVLSEADRAQFARAPHTEADWQRLCGVSELWGEAGYSTPERIGARPTLEVNGLLAGWTGEGAKTVLPAQAIAKISMRLVPDQDDTEVRGQLEAYLAAHAPSTVRWEVQQHSSNPGILLERNSPGMQAAHRALFDTFGVEPVFYAEGGSVPVVSMLKEKLGADSVLLGFGLPDDHIHSPNEKLYLPNYDRGIETFIRFLGEVAALPRPQ